MSLLSLLKEFVLMEYAKMGHPLVVAGALKPKCGLNLVHHARMMSLFVLVGPKINSFLSKILPHRTMYYGQM